MAMHYAYNYAEIDPATNMCIGIHTGTTPSDNPNFVEIPVYDEEYFLKYYIDRNWYEDAAGMIPWQSSLI